ncbi:MAG: hypothetical protein JXR54_11735 [Tannerellaceae bacterium]|nr:hypothetical protein [Tannerellaceae bacterium]
MSTVAIIKLEGCTIAKIYKHWDGDKEYTLPWLQEFNKSFIAERGADDDDYKLASLLRSSGFDASAYGLDASRHTGWGVLPYNDEYNGEFEYTLMRDGTVNVKEH